MMTSISRKLVDDIEKIRLRKTELRGLIRNNLSLLNIMTEDLTVYVSRLPRNRSNQVTTHIKWFLINVKELTERIEVSFSFESEDTKEKSKIVTIPSPPDDIPPELKAEDDVNICLKIIRDILISIRENKNKLCILGVIDPSEGMTSFVKGSICELVALLCGQARKFIRLLEKFPLEKRQLAKEEIEKAQDELVEMVTEIQLSFLEEIE